MSSYAISNPFPIFTDGKGDPVDDGYVYIGVPNLNPETNLTQVFWDEAMTIPAAQPIRTSGGYATRNGTPANIYAPGDYSITVRDKNHKFLYTAPSSKEVENQVSVTAARFYSVTDPQFAGGADTTGTTDARAAVQACVDYVNSIGGGVVFFPPGEYLFTTVGTHSHIDLINTDNIYMLGYGAFLRSTYGDGSRAFFYCDGARSTVIDGFEAQGTFTRSLSTVTTAGVSFVRVTSSSRDLSGISLRNLRAYNVYSWLSCYEPVASYRVRGIAVDNCFGLDGYYGLNFQNNGDLVSVRNFRTTRFVRTYFPYGVSNHDVQYESRDGDVFTDCLIKAYTRDTTDICVTATIIGNTSNDSHVTIESQHAPATQPVPAKLKNIELNINDLQAGGTGPSLRFAYFQDTPNPVQTPTSAVTLFDNVRVRGNVRNFLQFAVAQPVNSGSISLTGFVYNLVGSGDPYDFGFYEPMSRYVQGNNNYSLQVYGNKPLAAFGGLTFGQYNGTIAGEFDGTNGLSAFQFNQRPGFPFRFSYPNGYSAGTVVYQIPGNDSLSYGMKLYHSTIVTAPNAANSVMKIGTMDTTNRSISATGTINASGADYAEYERNNGLSIAKGDVVGFKADGTLTLIFAEAIRFGVKSTDPAIVGGDTWCSESLVGAAPVMPTRKQPTIEKGVDEAGRHVDIVVDQGDSDDEWAATEAKFQQLWDVYQSKVEIERAKVDRIAYSGKVPVNVIGAYPGGYIIAAEDGTGKIIGRFVADPDFGQYKLAVGRVNRILDDGRAEVAIIVH